MIKNFYKGRARKVGVQENRLIERESNSAVCKFLELGWKQRQKGNLAEDKVVRPEDLAIWPAPHRVHGTWFLQGVGQAMSDLLSYFE
jgi:hypothetical protein